jgi:deoxyribose-phosphate aldolase
MTASTISSARDLAPLIDHTLLREDATEGDILRAADEALQHGFAGVCVRAEWISRVAKRLTGTAVLPVAVVDFPRGTGTSHERVEEARRVVGDGAREVDVVFPLERLERRDLRGSLADLQSIVRVAEPATVKVILETGALSDPDKAVASAIAAAAGAAFVKTSTGYGAGGATEADVALLRLVVGAGIGVKASGGIRTAADAFRMIAAGASRLGTSASVAIVTAAR